MLEIIYIIDYWYSFINIYCEEKCNRKRESEREKDILYIYI